MFEHRKSPLISLFAFAKRLLLSGLLGLLTLMLVIGTGMIGFHFLVDLTWIDSYLEATMFFGGMGTAFPIVTWWGKFFAGTYAIFCPFGLIVTISILLMPFLHRFLHKFHLDENEK